MLSLWQLLLILLVGFFVVYVVWRIASTRLTLPCPPWLSFLVELDNPLFRSNRAATIIQGLDLKPGMRVLDAGCGPGRLTVPLSDAVGDSGEVVAVDLQRKMLDRAQAKLADERIRNVTFHEARLGTNALHFGVFDRAVMVTVLGEIPDQDSALAEIFAALRPGGVLAISEVIADPHFQSREHVLEQAAKVGFRERSRSGGQLGYTLYLERPFS